ncbi:MAG: adenylosuccinate lyase [Pirellulaceae bacterium]
MDQELYDNPLIGRYASAKMCKLWGPQKKFSTWRRLWLALAENERALGCPEISSQQLAEMAAHLDDIDFEMAARFEKELRHDVMAHVHTFGEVCPTARPVIHLGATSCYVTDNTDLILIRESLSLIAARLARVITTMATFAHEHRNLPCLAFTHLQPAQPTTVGKRACLWNYDLVADLEAVEGQLGRLRARGVKGTTGSQASFLQLFNGDHEKVKELDKRVSRAMGFEGSYSVTGQTYSRKVDAQVLDVLSGVGQSAHKMATDLRILAHRKELEEPFESNQIGSSAMAYKRNPMRSERICGLARFVISLQSSTANTFATQWLERTLDDSANRRLTLPQAFLAVDAILLILQNVVSGIVVYPQVIERNLQEELPFMATENLLMAAVERGGDRQEVHEVIRKHSLAAAQEVKMHGRPNDLLQRLKSERVFAGIDIDRELDAKQFVGRAPEQVLEFNQEVIEPIRRRYADSKLADESLRV